MDRIENPSIPDLLERQRTFFATHRTRDVGYRLERLKLLRGTIRARLPEIVEALRQDLGKGEFESFSGEVMNCLDEIKLALGHLRSWAAPRKAPTPMALFKARSFVLSEPHGVALLMSAWNYPFQLAMNPLVGAIAAGNCCIVKPSESAPHTSKVVASIVRSCFEEGHCAVVEGGVDTSTALLKERFDFILYTGGSKVGKIVAQAAAGHLTPLVLELGGKSPCIVDDTADIEISARRIAWGKFMNAGQTCVAPDYLLVHGSVKAPLVSALKRQIEAFYGKDPQTSPDYGRIVNIQHFERIASLLDEGEIVWGGRTDRDRLYIEPTILEQVDWGDRIMQEEIFGPLLPVLEYQDLSDAIGQVNAHDKPLALYVFSRDRKVQRRVLAETSSGGCGINVTVQQMGNPHLPAGGVGGSGMGTYHGEAGFRTFSHERAVLDKSLFFDSSFVYPPYGRKVRLLKWLNG
jgi:aldehyde dehydrogenase (NAD+)